MTFKLAIFDRWDSKSSDGISVVGVFLNAVWLKPRPVGVALAALPLGVAGPLSFLPGGKSSPKSKRTCNVRNAESGPGVQPTARGLHAAQHRIKNLLKIL